MTYSSAIKADDRAKELSVAIYDCEGPVPEDRFIRNGLVIVFLQT